MSIITYLLLLLDDENVGKFTSLYKKYHDPLLNYTCSILDNRRLSKEAVHDAFMRILKNLDKLSDIDCSKTQYYLVITVKRVCLTILKKEKPSLHQDMGENGLNIIEDKTEPMWSE